ncbi:MAG: NAD(P)H-dependent oxidoreductase subunit E [Legionella sp. 40-6]|nr:NADH-quinone oxidoreductase subunit NuoE [Legionella sp.]OJY14631.1 MAG: NAD(P)H-dependent oxidoreductase subunit E [Legionella sp. 40-6]
MSDSSVKKLHQLVAEPAIKEIDHWIAKYPADQRQSAVMSALMIVQEQHGHLTPELMDAVAEYLDMAPISVYEVASFYTMYQREPVGKNSINVCTSISCLLRKSNEVINHLEKKLGIKLGETTADGRFTLRSVECLGACVGAPMMQINKDYHEHLTPESIDQILDQYQ